MVACLAAINSGLAGAQTSPEARALYNRAYAAHREQQYSTATALFDSVILLDPRHADAWYARGWTKYRAGREADGLADIRRAAALNHKIARTYLLERGETPPALDTARRRPEPPRQSPGLLGPDDFRRAFTSLRAGALIGAMVLLTGILALALSSTNRPQVVHFELDDDEKQLWIGAPRQGIAFHYRDVGRTLIALCLCALGVLWLSGEVVSDALWKTVVVGTAMLVGGYYLLIGRFLYGAWQRKRTTYAVTTKRVIVSVGNSEESHALDSIDIELLPEAARPYLSHTSHLHT
jgi:tetratricopeptide (TPR) repeat protein